ncbi:hypothetical protein BU26DRAFT_281228 [Trematosphaeria pertusa]|uniref:Uncharacterized protein n=1 Tax=Trematosphaeria pertusa TaxID=390896 RepID=A0A6A6IP16_9PLEO|nr:uncharacterized protein BU26DRAFT_281228 [Trematosphaeria pertusa]KAF2251330.1 hypothetical protein BU26DRAFT_281228 [Trematosphaeria pertusa]
MLPASPVVKGEESGGVCQVSRDHGPLVRDSCVAKVIYILCWDLTFTPLIILNLSIHAPRPRYKAFIALSFYFYSQPPAHRHNLEQHDAARRSYPRRPSCARQRCRAQRMPPVLGRRAWYVVRSPLSSCLFFLSQGALRCESHARKSRLPFLQPNPRPSLLFIDLLPFNPHPRT